MVVEGAVELLWEIGGWVLEAAVDAWGGVEEKRPEPGEAPHLPLPEVEYHERGDPPGGSA